MSIVKKADTKPVDSGWPQPGRLVQISNSLKGVKTGAAGHTPMTGEQFAQLISQLAGITGSGKGLAEQIESLMMPSIAKNERGTLDKQAFLQEYNDGRGFWTAMKGGAIAVSETGLNNHKLDPRAPFVLDMNRLSPADYRHVAAKMDDKAKEYYLYNKYADLFDKWDNGHHSLKWSGKISPREIEHAGDMDTMLRELKVTITDPCDRELMASLNLFSDPAQQRAVQDLLVSDG